MRAPYSPAGPVPLGPLRDAPRERAARPLFYWPDYRANPYQRLLYEVLDRLDGTALKARPGTIEMALECQTVRSPAARPAIFHLHWDDAFFAGDEDERSAAASISRALASLDRFIALGGRFVWTVHNLGSHERRFPALENEFRHALAAIADAIHVHNRSTRTALIDDIGSPATEPVLIPHPSYAALPAVAAMAAADPWRPGPQTRFIHAGKLRAYKGIDRLLEAWNGLEGQDATLTIAGHPDIALPEPAPNLTLLPRALSDHELAAALASADFAVLPYSRVSTSGSLLLAFSLGVPAIVPDLPAMTELVTDGHNGFHFKCGDVSDLRRVMRRATATAPAERRAMREAAREVVRPWGWDALAPRFLTMITGDEQAAPRARCEPAVVGGS